MIKGTLVRTKDTRECGKIILSTEKVHFSMHLEMFMKANSEITTEQDKVTFFFNYKEL